MQNYINSKNTTTWNLSHDREIDPIDKVSFFSHGIYKNGAGSVELGYHQHNQGELSVNRSIIEGMFPQAFNDVNAVFYTCNSSTGGNNSVASVWKNHLGGFATGYVGKITYEYIMYPATYAPYKKVYSQKMRDIDKSIDASRKKYGFSDTGSYRYPVPSKNTTLKTY